MKVSVIITVYNLEKYIKEAIDSVFSQNYSDMEIIVVDDCSTDRSAAIIKDYNDKVTYIRTKENSGVLLAIAEGLNISTGDIILFLDGDDVWCEGKIQLVADEFRKDQSIIMVSHDVVDINQNGEIMNQGNPLNDVIKKYVDNKDLLDQKMKLSVMAYYGHVWLGSAYAIRNERGLLKEFLTWIKNLPDPAKTYQDHTLATYIIVNHPQGKLSYINKKLLKYRIHTSNYSGAYHDLISAKKIAVKGLNTANATCSLVIQTKNKKAIRRQKGKVIYFKYIINLCDKHFLKAFLSNIKLSLIFYDLKSGVKEWVRLIGLSLFGNFFLKMIKKK